MKYFFLIFLLGTQAFASVDIHGWNNLLTKITLVTEDQPTAMGISKSLGQTKTQGSTTVNSYISAMGKYNDFNLYQIEKVALTEESTTLVNEVWYITSDTYILSPEGDVLFASSNVIEKDLNGGVQKYQVNEISLPLSVDEDQKLTRYLQKWFN